MMVWNFPCKAAGPSPTSMYLLSVRAGEFIWAWVLAWASSKVSSFVEGEDTSKDLGRDKELWPATETEGKAEREQCQLRGPMKKEIPEIETS